MTRRMAVQSFSDGHGVSCFGHTIIFRNIYKRERIKMKRVLTAILALVSAIFIFASNARLSGPADNVESSLSARDDVMKVLDEISADSIYTYDLKLVSFGTRHTMSDTTSPTRGIGAARNWIASKFTEFASSNRNFKVYRDEFVQPVSPRISVPTTIVNVYGILWGKEGPSGRYIVLSGHYDTIVGNFMDSTADAPGADDDGSGSSLVIEAARAFTQSGLRPDANIVFLCCAAEEQGLYGSHHFAEMAKKNNWNIVADLNNDIVGGTRGGNGVLDNSRIRVFSESLKEVAVGERKIPASVFGYESDSPSRELARYIHQNAKTFLPAFKTELVFRSDRFLRGGDHTSFNQFGYAGVRFTEPNEDYNHQHQYVRVEDGVQDGDLPQFVDPQYVANVCKVNSATAALLSVSPAEPEDPVMLVDKLEYGTRLKWKNPRSENLSGWKVYYRGTMDPLWTNHVFVRASLEGDNVEVNLPELSKDKYIFGIAAVGANGAESPVVVPIPER
jgi:Peptidase family M28